MFERTKYLNQLISKENNHLIKVITGIRRSGKSFLLNNIFYTHLLNKGINNKNIIRFAFDSSDDIYLLDKYLENEPTLEIINGQRIINDKKFVLYVKEKIQKKGINYLLLDEIQNLKNFVNVLNSFLKYENFDVYVTGSNSYLLSSDIDTSFGGRSSRIHLLPLVFEELLSGSSKSNDDTLRDYMIYGGLPLVQIQSSDEEKMQQSLSILNDTYINDVKLRHPKVDEYNMRETLEVIASMISTPINPTKIENTFNSVYNVKLTNNTISNYIDWFKDAFLLNIAKRYDVKGRHYIGSPYKVYFEDIGIRNALLNYREIDETDIIENIVYNELRYRGYTIDVGIIPIKVKTDRFDKNGKPIYVDKETEVDFVANKNNKKIYIQVAFEIANQDKKDQEYESIRHIPDSFKKVIIVKNDIIDKQLTKEGFLRISLKEFLTNINSLEE